MAIIQGKFILSISTVFSTINRLYCCLTKKQVINRLIAVLQPDEKELYNAAKSGTGESVNLLYIRRLQKLDAPFSVAQLRKVSDGEQLSTGRTTAGGWPYVHLKVLS